MKPRIKVITLAVDDLERSLRFYRDGLGLPTKGIVGEQFEHGAVVFIEMNDGLVLRCGRQGRLRRMPISRQRRAGSARFRSATMWRRRRKWTLSSPKRR
jgi:hypothetical protein